MKNSEKTNAPILQVREFGFMPLQIALCDIPSGVNNLQCTDESMWVQEIHGKVTKFGAPNYNGARIPVPSGLNIQAWWQVLKNYDIPK